MYNVRITFIYLVILKQPVVEFEVQTNGNKMRHCLIFMVPTFIFCTDAHYITKNKDLGSSLNGHQILTSADIYNICLVGVFFHIYSDMG